MSPTSRLRALPHLVRRSVAQLITGTTGPLEPVPCGPWCQRPDLS